MPTSISAFEITEINKEDGTILIEDKDFGLEISIPMNDKNLISAQIVGPYEIKLRYENGTYKVVQFLE